MKKKFLIGVSGRMGTGKTAVLKLFERFGLPVLNADLVAHELYEKGGKGSRAVAKVFGKEFLREDGSVNRDSLRKYVLEKRKSVERMRLLNETIHPLVIEEVKKWVKEQARKGADFVCVETICLEKDCMGAFLDAVVMVESAEKMILARVKSQRNVLEQEVLELLKLQAVSLADAKKWLLKEEKLLFILRNSSTKKALEEKVKKLYTQLRYATRKL